MKKQNVSRELTVWFGNSETRGILTYSELDLWLDSKKSQSVVFQPIVRWVLLVTKNRGRLRQNIGWEN